MMTSVKLHMKSSWHVLGLQGMPLSSCLGCIFIFQQGLAIQVWCLLCLCLLPSAPCTFFILLFDLLIRNRGLIIPSKEKKKDKKSRLMRKLGRSKSENVVTQSQRAPGLVGLLETMRVQMEVIKKQSLFLCGFSELYFYLLLFWLT